MNYLMRRDPFTDLRSTMDRLFDEGFSRPRRFIQTETYQASMPVEISETHTELVIKASLPGVSPDEVDVSINDGVLTIKGEHKETTEEGKREFYRREIRYGGFNRSFTLPVKVDADNAEANYDNGVLTLHLPKAASILPKQIKVSTGTGATPAVADGTSDGSTES